MDSNFSDSLEHISPPKNGSELTLTELRLNDPFVSSTYSIQSNSQWSPSATTPYQKQSNHFEKRLLDDQSSQSFRKSRESNMDPIALNTTSTSDNMLSKRNNNINFSGLPNKYSEQDIVNSFHPDDASYSSNSNSSSKSSRIAAREEFIRQKIIADRQIANAKSSHSVSSLNNQRHLGLNTLLNSGKEEVPVSSTNRSNSQESTLGMRVVPPSINSNSLKVSYMTANESSYRPSSNVVSSSNSLSSSNTTMQSDISTTSSSISNSRSLSNHRPSKSDFEKARRLLSR